MIKKIKLGKPPAAGTHPGIPTPPHLSPGLHTASASTSFARMKNDTLY